MFKTANSTSTIVVTDSNYSSLVENSEIPVLLNFWSPSCVPCMLMKRSVEKAADLLGDEVRVGLVNVSEQAELVAQFGVQGTPMFAVVKKGQVVLTFGGMTTAGELAHRARNGASGVGR